MEGMFGAPWSADSQVPSRQRIMRFGISERMREGKDRLRERRKPRERRGEERKWAE